MTDETIEGIIETQKHQTETIKELLDICETLVERVLALGKDK